MNIDIYFKSYLLPYLYIYFLFKYYFYFVFFNFHVFFLLISLHVKIQHFKTGTTYSDRVTNINNRPDVHNEKCSKLE